MRIVIIEDEPLIAEDLESDLHALRPDWLVVARLGSVHQGREWFAKGLDADLIFSDIQLGDGSCFDLFDMYPPKAPVVFCTAYDQFAVNAFQTNGIGYLLKPFSMANLEAAIEKYERLRPASPALQDLMALLQPSRPSRQRLLVHHRDKIIPIALDEVAVFYLHHEITMLMCMDGMTYHLTQVLGEIELVAGESFFRASRQHLVSRAAVKSAVPQLSRKLVLELKVPFSEQVSVSKEKVPIFLEWLGKSV